MQAWSRPLTKERERVNGEAVPCSFVPIDEKRGERCSIITLHVISNQRTQQQSLAGQILVSFHDLADQTVF